MARPLRLEFPGAVYHITTRGNAAQDIFISDDDRRAFLDILGRVCHDLGWLCHAYCLMSNHYHLLVETPESGLSRGMRQINGVYTQTFNRRHRRGGHVFQGRFHSVLVDRQSYLLELCRYIVLNPVRARMVGRPADYSWSSYRATTAMAPRSAWLHTDWILSQFGNRRAKAVAAYVRFVDDGGARQRPWDDLKDQVFLGSDAFVATMKARIPDDDRLREVPRVQRRSPPRPIAWYADTYRDRNQAIAMAYRSNDHSQQDIAKYFALHYTSVSRIIGKAREADG